MNKNLKCVIFDLDGTLIDSGPDLLNTLNYVLTENNLKEINGSVIGNLVGGGAEAMIRRGYKHLNLCSELHYKLVIPTSYLRHIMSNFITIMHCNATSEI